MKKLNKQHVNLNVQVSYLHAWGDDMQKLPPNQTFELVIDYPVSTRATYKLRTGKSGMGLGRLLKEINKAYGKVFAAADKYGVWGHDMTDLALEGITVDFKKKTIRLDVGS